MFYSVEIEYPKERMLNNRLRLESTYGFQSYDRVPVLLGIEPRYLLYERGVTFPEYFADADTQLIHQLENLKWRIENIPDDWMTAGVLTVSPDFQNVTNANGCGCDVFWQENETPHAGQQISTLDEMIRFELPRWETTLWGKKAEWFYRMRELVGDVDVRLNGERIPVHVALSINGDSPFMTAVELAGAGFYAWLIEAPLHCHDMLNRITNRYIEVESEYRRITGRPMRDGMNYSDDSAQVISLKQYREFCVPSALRLYATFGCERFDGRLMHLCGRNVHLHEALLHDLQITMLHGFGSANSPEEMKMLSGRTILQGNIDPLLLYEGSCDAIFDAATSVLGNLGPNGGLILGDGYNVVPGTPTEKLRVLLHASETFGIPQLLQRGGEG